MADRQAEISDTALDAIDEAIARFRADLRATRPVRQADGSITEEPVVVIGPRDLAVLIDRLQVLFDRPSVISEGRGLTITSEAIPVEVFREIVGLTRAEPAPEASKIPRLPRRLDD